MDLKSLIARYEELRRRLAGFTPPEQLGHPEALEIEQRSSNAKNDA